jgi:hypothetical protein
VISERARVQTIDSTKNYRHFVFQALIELF